MFNPLILTEAAGRGGRAARGVQAAAGGAAHPRPPIQGLIRSQLRASLRVRASDPWDFAALSFVRVAISTHCLHL